MIHLKCFRNETKPVAFPLSSNPSCPTVEWPSLRPIRRRICRTHPSTAITTAAWRSRRPPAPSHHRGRGSGLWLYRRTTTSGPHLTAALARWSTRRTVRPGGVSPPSTPLFTSSIHPSTQREAEAHLHTYIYTHTGARLKAYQHRWVSHTL